MYKKVTMQTIADELGISKATVHKALAGKSDISQQLKKTILETCEKYEYNLIDPLAKLSKTFYYIMSATFNTSTEQFYSKIYKMLCDRFNERGITLHLKVVREDFSPIAFSEHVKKFQSYYFGFIVAGQLNDKILAEIEESGIPTVIIDYYSPKFDLNYIYIDNYKASYCATDYLLNLGMRDIALILDASSTTSNMDRYYGFLKCLHANGVPFVPSMHINLDFAKMTNIALFSPPEPLHEAYILDCDMAANNFIITMMSKGYRIPQDFSVMSFDDTDLCTDITPRLTSIGPNKDEIIDICYDLLLHSMQNPQKQKQTVSLISKLHIRESVKSKEPLPS